MHSKQIKPSQKTCPQCGKRRTLYRSHSRNFFENIINHSRIFMIKRCHECGWRGIRLRTINLNFKLRTFVFYLILLLIVYFIARKILLNYI